jgi:carbonic anhydrase
LAPFAAHWRQYSTQGAIAVDITSRFVLENRAWAEDMERLRGPGEESLARCVDRLVTINVAAQVRSLAESVTVRRAWQRGQGLRLHGWVYGLRDGRLRDVLTLDANGEALARAA